MRDFWGNLQENNTTIIMTLWGYAKTNWDSVASFIFGQKHKESMK